MTQAFQSLFGNPAQTNKDPEVMPTPSFYDTRYQIKAKNDGPADSEHSD